MQCENCGASTFVNHGDGLTVLCSRCAASDQGQSLLADKFGKQRADLTQTPQDLKKQLAIRRGITAALIGGGIPIVLGYLHAQSLCGGDGGGVLRGLAECLFSGNLWRRRSRRLCWASSCGGFIGRNAWS